MAERWQPLYESTLPWDVNMLSHVDDQEGFRILVQDRQTLFVYGIYANVVFHRRCTGLYDAAYRDSIPQRGESRALIFQVHDSSLVTTLKELTDVDTIVREPLTHYALCFASEDRSDIVCTGALTVRAAHSRWGQGGE